MLVLFRSFAVKLPAPFHGIHISIIIRATHIPYIPMNFSGFTKLPPISPQGITILHKQINLILKL